VKSASEESTVCIFRVEEQEAKQAKSRVLLAAYVTELFLLKALGTMVCSIQNVYSFIVYLMMLSVSDSVGAD
jgi:hypothetical protein